MCFNYSTDGILLWIFVIVKYNGLFSIFILLVFSAASDAHDDLLALSSPPKIFCSQAPTTLPDLSYSATHSWSLNGASPRNIWGFLGSSPYQQLKFFFPFSLAIPIILKEQIFFGLLMTSKSIQSLSWIPNMNFKLPIEHPDLEALEALLAQWIELTSFSTFPSPSPSPSPWQPKRFF